MIHRRLSEAACRTKILGLNSISIVCAFEQISKGFLRFSCEQASRLFSGRIDCRRSTPPYVARSRLALLCPTREACSGNEDNNGVSLRREEYVMTRALKLLVRPCVDANCLRCDVFDHANRRAMQTISMRFKRRCKPPYARTTAALDLMKIDELISIVFFFRECDILRRLAFLEESFNLRSSMPKDENILYLCVKYVFL